MAYFGANANRAADEWIPLGDMPIALVCGAVKAEDRFFFDHQGVDVIQTLKALRSQVVTTGLRVGGSTITQQLARNMFLTPDRTWIRKVHELIYSWCLDRRLSKRRILELYLNVAQFDDDVWGVGPASLSLFGTPVHELSPFQAVLLVSRLPAPTKPLTGRNRMRAELVVRRVLGQLHASGVVDAGSYAEARRDVDAFFRADDPSGVTGVSLVKAPQQRLPWSVDELMRTSCEVVTDVASESTKTRGVDAVEQ